jgi:hypothetical protein
VSFLGYEGDHMRLRAVDNTAVHQDPGPGPVQPPISHVPPPPSFPPPPYPAQQASAYVPTAIAPTDGGAVWAFVMGLLSWFMCPLLGVIAFFVGGSALNRIRASRGALRGDGLAHAGRALGCLANSIWLLALLLVFGACSLGALSTVPFLHPSPSP